MQPIGRKCSRSVGPVFPHGIKRWQRPPEPKLEADKPRTAAMCRMHVAWPQDSLDRDNDMLARTRALLGLPLQPAAQPKQQMLLRDAMPEDMQQAR